MDTRFTRVSFESTEFLLESVEKPKIKAGGSSSSNILNRYFNALANDVTMLAARTNLLAARSDRIEQGAAIQAGALLAQFQSLSTRVDAVSSLTQVMADMHSSTYVDVSNTATISTTFGQATLPEISSIDLLVQTDVYGNKYTAPEIEVAYALGSTPDALAYTLDPDAALMLRDEQLWLLPETSQTVWVRLRAPLQYRGLTPNMIEFWPFPAFAHDIEQISYLPAGDSYTGAYVDLDLSYLPNYKASTGKVEQAGPVRVFLPNSAISELRVKMTPRSSTAWGVHKFKVYHKEFSNSATLVVKDPYSRTAGSVVLRGKDTSDLAQLAVTTNTNTVSVALTSTSSVETPIITGIIFTVT